MTRRTIAAIGSALLLNATAFAADRSDDIARLEVAKDRLATGAESVKPNQAARMRADADDLQTMINRLEAGNRVDPGEVDRAINRSHQNY